MTSSILEAAASTVRNLTITGERLRVDLTDGRAIEVPLDWYPRLRHPLRVEFQHWEAIGGGAAIRWRDLDEDVSVQGLLAGQRFGGRGVSLQGWLASRSK